MMRRVIYEMASERGINNGAGKVVDRGGSVKPDLSFHGPHTCVTGGGDR